MTIANVELPEVAITEICRRYGVTELSVFGSALRDDFGPDSDIDFLVIFENDDAGPWMSKFTELEQILGEVLGHKVDVVDKHAVEQSENYIRRKHILESAQVVYVA